MASTGAAATDEAGPGKTLPLVLVVAVALLDAQGRVLLAQRPPGKKLAGLWEFPGEESQRPQPSHMCSLAVPHR